jgi:phosphohistidine phosphatase
VGSVRTLYAVRHAKSSWDDPSLDDRARPLAPRGRRAVARLAAYVDGAGIEPELVLCSPARRARATLDGLLPHLGEKVTVRIDEALYAGSPDQLLRLLRRTPPETGSLMLVGHNPELHELLVLLTGDGDVAARRQLHTKFPTGALATLDLGATEWGALDAGRAYLRDLVLPRKLPKPEVS